MTSGLDYGVDVLAHDGGLVDDETAGIEFEGDTVILDGDDAPVDTTGGEHLVAHRQLRLELFELLLSLALGSEEQEVHAHEKEGVNQNST
jgi:hypothetical protein